MGGTLIHSFLGANVVEVLSPAMAKLEWDCLFYTLCLESFKSLEKNIFFLEELLHLPCQSCLGSFGTTCCNFNKKI